MINRRSFLEAAASAVVAAPVLVERARSATPPVERLARLGVALFTIPKLLDQDFAGALKLLSGIGYREVQFFGPYPFSVPAAHERWKAVSASLGLRESGFFGRSPRDVRALLDASGLTAPAMHVDIGTLRTRLAESADAARALATTYVGISSIPADERRTLDGYKRIADEFNQIGARAKALGVRFAYHNHGYGLTEVEGQVPLRVVLERTDPALVWMEMDLFWTVAGGGDPVELLDTYKGRYRLMHVKDMKPRVRFSGDGGDAAQWIELFPYVTDAGSGVLDLPKILAHARRSGVEHFLVEQDLVADPDGSLRRSYRFLSGLDL
jgi:sugar phosphate isomerase/epimerase